MRQCPECRAKVQVLETRQKPGHTRRRYECSNGHRYTTMELLEADIQAADRMEAQRRLNAALNLARKKMGLNRGYP